jgi:hypothetical protein
MTLLRCPPPCPVQALLGGGVLKGVLAPPLPMPRADVVNLPESVAARLAAACLRFLDVDLAPSRPESIYVRKRCAVPALVLQGSVCVCMRVCMFVCAPR